MENGKIKILFVCSGNTCRSPMAEAIMNQLKTKDERLSGCVFDSAGLNAQEGEPVNPLAVSALKSLGITPPKHTARNMTKSDTETADIIVCMTAAHKKAIDCRKTVTVAELTGGNDVSDPYGKGEDEYLRAARYLYYAADDLADKIEKLAHLNGKS